MTPAKLLVLAEKVRSFKLAVTYGPPPVFEGGAVVPILVCEEIATALEQIAKQEPVAWLSPGGDVSRSRRYFEEMGFTDLRPLYAAPPAGGAEREAQHYRNALGIAADQINAAEHRAEQAVALLRDIDGDLVRCLNVGVAPSSLDLLRARLLANRERIRALIGEKG